MYGGIEIIADCRIKDMLADAARERLAKQAQLTQPFASLSQAVLGSSVQTVFASARGALDAFSRRALDASGTKRAQNMITLAR